MKSNLILLPVIMFIIVFGLMANTNTNQKRISKKQFFQRYKDDAKSTEANSSSAASSPDNSAKKSLLNLNAIINKIQQKQPNKNNDNNDVDDMQLYLEQRFNSESLNSPQELNHNKQCELKQGYLTEIVKQENIKNKTIAQGRHVFAVLNKQTISIFEAVHVNSLIASLDLEDIDVPVVTMKKLNCFQLQNKNKKERGFQLCASNQKEMNAWISDIKNMLTCQVSDKEQVEDSEEDTSDELKIKVLKKKAQLTSEQNNQDADEQNQQAKSQELQKIQQQKDEQQKKIIEEQMSRALEEIKKKRQIEEKRKRIEEYRRKKQEAQNKKIEEDLKCMEKKLEGEEYNARKLVEIQIKDQTSETISSDLNQTISKISSSEQKGIEQLMQDEKELTEEKKDLQNKFQDILIQEVEEYEKEINPNQCFSSDNLYGAKVKPICHSYILPGQAVDFTQLKQCLDINQFCNVCCNYNYGKSKQLEIKSCSDKCEQVVNRENWLKNKSKTGVLSEIEKQELMKLVDNGFLVTIGKGDRVPAWSKLT